MNRQIPPSVRSLESLLARVARPLVLFLAVVSLSSELHAQERQLAGTVVAADDSTGLEGVSVGLVGGTAGTITDAAGHFTLRAPLGLVRLTIRRIGFASDTVAVAAGQDSVVIFARVLREGVEARAGRGVLLVRRRAGLPLAALVMASTACKLSEEVTAPPGESTVIAQMVLNTAAPVQRLLLERSDGGASSVRLSGAMVRLTHLNPDASCARPTVTLTEASDSILWGRSGETRRVYQTRELCALHAGDRVALRVETPQGEIVTGTTQIPGANRLLVKAGPVSALAPRVLSLDRTRDSIHVELDPRFARGLEIEVVRKGGNPPQNSDSPTDPVFDITTDTLHATIAGSLLNPFEDEDRRTIFRAGGVYLISFAPTDTNYFDFVRSGANPFTGRGFINYLSGGIGVFGSVAPQTYEVRVTAPQRDPREGVYRIFGGANAVDVRWDVYLDAASAPDEFSALTDGTWIEGPVSASVDGTFAGGFHAVFYGVPADPLATTRALYLLDYNGSLPRRGTSFEAILRKAVGGQTTTDRVTVVQVSGP